MSTLFEKQTAKAVENPTVQKAIGTAVVNSVIGHDGDERHITASRDIPEQELAKVLPRN